MRLVSGMLVGWVCATLSVQAQVDFSARILYRESLVCEPMPTVITIRNNRVEPLNAGGAQGYSLTFEVTDTAGLLLRPFPDAAVEVPAQIPPQSTVVFTNDLQRLFPVSRHQAIGVRARLTVGERSFVTERTFVDILPGVEIARLQAAAPGGEIHTYTLRLLNRENRDHLFLRVSNEEDSICYGVADLGRVVRMGKPTLEVDEQSRVHVLHLSGPGLFTYTIFDAAGSILNRSSFMGDVSSVRLEPDNAGSFRVVGAGQIAPPKDPIVEPLPVRRGL